MEEKGHRSVEPVAEAEDDYMTLVSDIAKRSLMPKANTWYVGANIPGKPRFFPIFAGGLNRYREMCAEAATAGYRGFMFDSREAPRRERETASARPAL